MDPSLSMIPVINLREGNPACCMLFLRELVHSELPYATNSIALEQREYIVQADGQNPEQRPLRLQCEADQFEL